MTSPCEQLIVRCSCGHLYLHCYRASANAWCDPEMAADEAYLDEASSVTCPNARSATTSA